MAWTLLGFGYGVYRQSRGALDCSYGSAHSRASLEVDRRGGIVGSKTISVIGAMLLLGAVLGIGGSAGASTRPQVRATASIQASERSTEIAAAHIKVRPAQGPGGTEVRVRGRVSAGCWVNLDFIDANGSESGLGRVPPGGIDFIGNISSGAALGAGQVRAIGFNFIPRLGCRPDGGAQAPFTVTDGPRIFGFTPRSGPVGTVVTITGIRFSHAKAVKFGGTPSLFTVDSDSQITATVPAGATTGAIKIVTRLGKAVSGPDYVVT